MSSHSTSAVRRAITHFAGPTWRARDGSTVVGALADATPGGPLP
jgi:hypothetical protein